MTDYLQAGFFVSIEEIEDLTFSVCDVSIFPVISLRASFRIFRFRYFYDTSLVIFLPEMCANDVTTPSIGGMTPGGQVLCNGANGLLLDGYHGLKTMR